MSPVLDESGTELNERSVLNTDLDRGLMDLMHFCDPSMTPPPLSFNQPEMKDSNQLLLWEVASRNMDWRASNNYNRELIGCFTEGGCGHAYCNSKKQRQAGGDVAFANTSIISPNDSKIDMPMKSISTDSKIDVPMDSKVEIPTDSKIDILMDPKFILSEEDSDTPGTIEV